MKNAIHLHAHVQQDNLNFAGKHADPLYIGLSVSNHKQLIDTTQNYVCTISRNYLGP